MKLRIISTLGLVFGLVGLAIFSDTFLVWKALADPIPPDQCACYTPSANTKKCISEPNWLQCEGQPENVCKLYPAEGGAIAGKDYPILFLTNNGNIPDGCDKTLNKVNCGTETISCFRHVPCKWNAAANPARCETDTDAKQEAWWAITSAERRKEEACPQGSDCPPK